MILRIDEAAERDLDHGVRWFETKQRHLGLEFLMEFEGLLPSIRDFPESFALWKPSTDSTLRRAVPNFPYVIVFVLLPEEIRVLAVQHTARKPTD